jgi:serine/threonine protein kinase
MIEAGTILQNRYLIKKPIGQGGMGKVFVGTDQRFGSAVAIKETLFDDETLRKAFEREARLLNSLRHPALPRVSDHFIEGNGQFLVMEYITGEDLSEMVEKRGAFPLSDALNWSDQLLDALDYLHTQEMPVVHRDIKPQNLKLTPRGQIILLDFGLAKGNATNNEHQTAAKSVFGYSKAYAPLEQIQGTGTDPRSDLYSLAATVYHLITGIIPADALTRATTVLNGGDDPLRPPHEILGVIPPAVSELLMRAMALNANQRPVSAAAMRALMLDAAKDAGSFAQTVPDLKVHPDLLAQQTQVISDGRPAAGSSDKTAAANIPETSRAPVPIEVRPVMNVPSAPSEVTNVRPAAALAATRPSRSFAKVGLAGTAVLLAGGASAFYFMGPQFSQGVGANSNSANQERVVGNEARPNVNPASLPDANAANSANIAVGANLAAGAANVSSVSTNVEKKTDAADTATAAISSAATTAGEKDRSKVETPAKTDGKAAKGAAAPTDPKIPDKTSAGTLIAPKTAPQFNSPPARAGDHQQLPPDAPLARPTPQQVKPANIPPRFRRPPLRRQPAPLPPN